MDVLGKPSSESILTYHKTCFPVPFITPSLTTIINKLLFNPPFMKIIYSIYASFKYREISQSIHKLVFY